MIHFSSPQNLAMERRKVFLFVCFYLVINPYNLEEERKHLLSTNYLLSIVPNPFMNVISFHIYNNSSAQFLKKES